MQNTSEILLWLFIINLGIAFGAGLYEARIMLPQWFFKKHGESKFSVNTEAMRKTDTGKNFWGMVTTLPLTLLTVANLVVAWNSTGLKHDWWLAAGLIMLIERMGTLFYFIPTAIKLMFAENLSPSKVASLVSVWMKLNHVRNILMLLGWLAALKALTLF